MTTRITLLTTLFIAMMTSLALPQSQGLDKVTEEDAREWMQHLVPMPKQIEITAKLIITGNRVAVDLVGSNDPLAGQALLEVRTALRLGRNFPRPRAPECILKLQVGGPEATPLEKLDNPDQAYRIIPLFKEREVTLVALTDQGMYYACKTLTQLIYAKNPTFQVEIPFASVTDWPDMKDRGLWGADSSNHLVWMADRKMNYNEQISKTYVDENKRCYAEYQDPTKLKMIDEGPTLGINPVPVILHLEQLKNRGIFEAYPDLQGKDATEGVICFSNPKFVDILAEWLTLWGDTPGVTEVDVWMTENMAGKTSCQCDACKKHDPAVLEAQAILKAYDKAKQQIPGLHLRILTSEATEKSNPKILELLPPDVKLWYYHSLRTYNTSRRPMIPDYLAKAAKNGRWIGVCPNLSSVINFWSPMICPQFIHARMNEFVDKKLSGLLGYATPELCYTMFNVEAAAEWSWNAKGRSPREFAISYAVRSGCKDPELFAEWVDTMGPVSWDVYGSDWPSGEKRRNPGPVATRLKEGTLGELGDKLWGTFACPWGEIKTPAQLNDNVDRAQRAVEIAQKLNIPELIQESLVIQGYIQSLKALWELRAIVKSDGISDDNRDAAKHYFQMYVDSLAQSADALTAWQKTLPCKEPDPKQMDKPIGVINTSIDQMIDVAEQMGIEIKRPEPKLSETQPTTDPSQ